MKNLLFVCLGNICRSPAAEEIMRQIIAADPLLRGRWLVDSAAIGAWHVGQLPDLRMRRHGMLRGYDFRSRARQIVRQDFDRFDLVLGMDAGNMEDLSAFTRTDTDRAKLRSLAAYMTRHPSYTTIPDPYYGGDDDFELALNLIEDACQGLARALHEEQEEFFLI